MLTFLTIKLIVLGVGALAWGVYCGLKGLDLSGRPAPPGQRGKPPRD